MHRAARDRGGRRLRGHRPQQLRRGRMARHDESRPHQHAARRPLGARDADGAPHQRARARRVPGGDLRDRRPPRLHQGRRLHERHGAVRVRDRLVAAQQHVARDPDADAAAQPPGRLLARRQDLCLRRRHRRPRRRLLGRAVLRPGARGVDQAAAHADRVPRRLLRRRRPQDLPHRRRVHADAHVARDRARLRHRDVVVDGARPAHAALHAVALRRRHQDLLLRRQQGEGGRPPRGRRGREAALPQGRQADEATGEEVRVARGARGHRRRRAGEARAQRAARHRRALPRREGPLRGAAADRRDADRPQAREPDLQRARHGQGRAGQPLAQAGAAGAPRATRSAARPRHRARRGRRQGPPVVVGHGAARRQPLQGDVVL
mmetsp:Transcript_15484/g.49950  ORF Transcript_15484/g.49950 Transcript_15484/m.49950 type:complete len:378 (-) Transcript_15484:482-1615(-)